MAKTKKSVRLLIAERLEKSFADLKEPLGKGGFRRNIKKAAKALTEDLKEIKVKPVKADKKKAKKKKEKEKEPAVVANKVK